MRSKTVSFACCSTEASRRQAAGHFVIEVQTLLSVLLDPRAISSTLDLAQPESRSSVQMANSMLKTTAFVGQQLAAPRPTRPCASRASVRVAAAADRPLFFPGAAPPEYLDDSLAGLLQSNTECAWV